MRKFITFAAAFLCLAQMILAVPAKKGLIPRVQPDGTTIMVRIHGDEWFHYVTDEAGNLLEENESGYLVRSAAPTVAALAEKMKMAQAVKDWTATKRQEEMLLSSKPIGSPKIPVVLVQFADRKFVLSNPKTAFTNLLTQRGYSANGGTGSVLDYYEDQSRGLYSPQFVVMDVVTLSGSMSTYGSTDENAAKALYEACQKLDSSVDFSQFDNDGDGKIDMALLYYAGYNEAEGGDSETIWPHQFYVPYVVTNAQPFDGVTLNRYFCTSELKGYYGTNMCGIGTTCHEFAHSIGLPDFYDTNYNNYGDGEAGATYAYDVMCEGSYNNNGCTPPWMNAEELVMLGWMDSITEFSNVGSVNLPAISAANPIAYKSATSASGEYFLYECRSGTGWDAPLAAGLLVYHVDKSTSHSISWKYDNSTTRTQTAYNLWANWESYNAINCNGSHPCFYIVPSGAQTSLNYSGSYFTFPGTMNVKTYSPIDWAGAETGITLSNIAYNSASQTVTLNLANSNQCGVEGVVMDVEGNPLQGATVTMRTSSVSSVSSFRLGKVSRMVAGSVLWTVKTSADGSYSISIENPGTYVLEVSKDGYVSKSVTVTVSRIINQNFYLLREGESAPSDIYTYPDDAEWYSYGFSETSADFNVANFYPASMLNPYAGKQIKSISFMIAGEEDTTGKVYALLDFGSVRKVALEVKAPIKNGWTTVDLSNQELIIPENTDIYAGYGLDAWTYPYPFVATEDLRSEDLEGKVYYFDLSSTTWYDAGLVYAVRLTIGDYTAPETGYNMIEDPSNGVYAVGSEFFLNLLETASDKRPSAAGVDWFYDDEPVSGSIRLNRAGTHRVTAKFTTEGGAFKVVELEIDVR